MIELALRIKGTERYFRGFEAIESSGDTDLLRSIAVDPAALKKEAHRLNGDWAFAEYSLLLEKVSSLILMILRWYVSVLELRTIQSI